jgi:excisionase family DNA binding protein
VNDRLLTTRQVADYLGFSPETVLRRYRTGELAGIRLASNVLRFREADVEAWLELCSRPGRPIALGKTQAVGGDAAR